jgi:hypothetical protein
MNNKIKAEGGQIFILMVQFPSPSSISQALYFNGIDLNFLSVTCSIFAVIEFNIPAISTMECSNIVAHNVAAL